MLTREQLLDRIAGLVAENIHAIASLDNSSEDSSDYIDVVTLANQFKVEGGKFVQGRTSEEEVVLFSNDTLAASANDIETIDSLRTLIGDVDVLSLSLSVGQGEVNLIWPGEGNQVNLLHPDYLHLLNNISQILGLQRNTTLINPSKAKEILDTKIYELIPNVKTRQQRINDFFKAWSDLKGEVPPFTADVDGDEQPDTFGASYDTLVPGDQTEITAGQNLHNEMNDINPSVNPDEGNIVRLDRHAVGTENEGQTLETLWREIGQYLSDLKEWQIVLDDTRPIYTPKTGGYLKIRKLNQSIIIRKQEGNEIGFEKMTEGPIVIGENDFETTQIGPSYLIDGFTISMWVKFLDSADEPDNGIGTLFNYGNPYRIIDPKGFRLETFVLNKNKFMNVETPSQTDGTMSLRTWGEWADQSSGVPGKYFANSDYERFVRLSVYDHINYNLYGSHLGVTGDSLSRENTFPQFGHEYNSGVSTSWTPGFEGLLLQNVTIPVDFDEWYFIVASYNPRTTEELISDFGNTPEYWLGHIQDGSAASPVYTNYSGRGAKCKVEVISKTDLLRARGFKV